MRKKIVLVILGIVILAGAGFGIYKYKKSKILNNNGQITDNNSHPSSCLTDNEYADYLLDEKAIPELSLPKEKNTIDLSVRNKINGRELLRFQINNILYSYHPAEIHKCGIYIIKEFNFDEKQTKPLLGFKVELWKHSYNNEGEKLLVLAGENESGKPTVYYGYDFRVSPNEKYVVLERGYQGKDDYAIVIKNIETKEDVFVLQAKDVLKKYPEMQGDFGMNEWTKDGKYYWGNIFDGANVGAFVRVEAETWKYEILPVLPDTLGGDALNAEKGLITVHPGNIWYGFEDMTQEEIARRRAKGIGTELYIYDLFAKTKQFVASTTEPLWYFAPKWISTNELEYKMPSGEKRVWKTMEN